MTASAPAIAGRLLLYAPNVHTGGGFVLLKALLEDWPADKPLVAWLDDRARGTMKLRTDARVVWVKASAGSRLGAEFSLAREGRASDTALCFHGLPPLLKQRAKIVLFQQNRNYFGEVDLTTFAWRTRQRLRYEQTLSRVFRHRVQTYWVQTPSMARNLRNWFGNDAVDVRVLPFVLVHSSVEPHPNLAAEFLYVADGEAHKNHETLLKAWQILADQGLRPSLTLTLTPRDARLRHVVALATKNHDLNISDLGLLPHAQVLSLYGNARALIFPSLSESFGLPLVEARRAGLPIIASELDFVRDVCAPVETFDPKSAVSIARAVRRFMGVPEAPVDPRSPADFLQALFNQ